MVVQLSPGGAYEILRPLILFIVGLAIYSIIVYNLYRFVATRDIFNLNLNQYNTSEHAFLSKFFAVCLYIVEYLMFFPLFLLVWFIAFSVIFVALSANPDIEIILLVSMAMISSIRVVSYYSKSLAQDIAKLIPFVLLAVFLTDGASAFNWSNSIQLIKTFPTLLDTLIYYFFFVIALEFILRIVYSMTKALSSRDEN